MRSQKQKQILKPFSPSCFLFYCVCRMSVFSPSSHLWPLPKRSRRTPSGDIYVPLVCFYAGLIGGTLLSAETSAHSIFSRPRGWLHGRYPTTFSQIFPAQCAMRCCNPSSPSVVLNQRAESCFTSRNTFLTHAALLPRCCKCADVAQRAGLQAALLTFRSSTRCHLIS